MFMFTTLFAPLILYAYAYVADKMQVRIAAITLFVLYAFLAVLLVGFLGVLKLHNFLTLQLPQFAIILQISFAFAFLSFGIFLPFLLFFTLQSLILVRLNRWISSQIPKRLLLEGIDPRRRFGALMRMFRSRRMFMLSFAITTVELAAIEVMWAIGLVITAPLDQTWKIPFLMGWLLSPALSWVPSILLGYIQRLQCSADAQ